MAAIFDNHAEGKNGSGASSLSFNMTIGNLGDTGLIVVIPMGEDTSGGSTNQRITGVTFNSVAMTLVNSDENATGHSTSVAMYELHGPTLPAAGTYSVVVSYTSTCESQAACCMSFRGIKSQVKEATNKGNANGTTPFSVAVTTLTPNALLIAGYGNQNAGATAFTTGELGSFSATGGAGEDSIAFAGYKIVAAPGSTTTTITNASPETEAMILASFEIAPENIDDYAQFM